MILAYPGSDVRVVVALASAEYAIFSHFALEVLAVVAELFGHSFLLLEL